MKWLELFYFSPRAGRGEYVSVSLCCQFLSLLAFLGQGWFNAGNSSWAQFLFALAVGFVMAVGLLLVFVIQLAVTFRRLHDLNLSGGWYILYGVVSMVLSLLFAKQWWLFSVAGLAVLLFLSLKKSTKTENRFGPAPKEFFPALFSRKTLFTAAVLALALVSAGQVWVSRFKLTAAASMQSAAGQTQPSIQVR